MTETSISLLSILFGILGANGYSYFVSKKPIGLTGASIGGVFGSALFIKSFGRLGFDPSSIMDNHEVSLGLLSVNLLFSVLGGIVAVLIATKLSSKL